MTFRFLRRHLGAGEVEDADVAKVEEEEAEEGQDKDEDEDDAVDVILDAECIREALAKDGEWELVDEDAVAEEEDDKYEYAAVVGRYVTEDDEGIRR